MQWSMRFRFRPGRGTVFCSLAHKDLDNQPVNQLVTYLSG